MFTGIIQAIGEIKSMENQGDALQITVGSHDFFSHNVVGDSISNDGVCLTIEKCTADEAQFTLIHQTVSTTAFAVRKQGSRLNLEQACRPDSFMGGHFVMGHVDGTAQVKNIIPRETGMELELELPSDLERYVISKGSICLNGISLTVAEKRDAIIRIALIPETLAKTNIEDWLLDHPVNVEVDMIGKYVENFLKQSGYSPQA